MEMRKYDFKMGVEGHGEVLTIIPLGDIQWAGKKNEGVALRLLQETIKRGQDQNAYYIGMGDYIDFASPSNRMRLKAAALYDTAMDVVDNAADALVEEIAEILEPTAGRWLGLLEGHHFYEFPDGSTSDTRLAKKLRTHHLGTTAYIGLVLRQGTKKVLVNLWATHGCGNGQRAVAPAGKLESVAVAWEADIMLMGHMTKMAHAPIDRVYPAWERKSPDLHHRDVHLVGTGGFSKGYIVGSKNGDTPRGSYVESGMMRPTVLGAPTIRIRPERVCRNGSDLLLRKITVEL